MLQLQSPPHPRPAAQNPYLTPVLLPPPHRNPPRPGTNRLRQVRDHVLGQDMALPASLHVGQPITMPASYVARQRVTADSRVSSGNVQFRAGHEIVFQAGFEADPASGTFTAETGPQLDYDAEQHGFVERGGADYAYDANGNLLASEDGDISHITYNHLNLPDLIQQGADRRTRFVYTATGIKLASIREERVGGSWEVVRRQDYPGGYELRDGQVAFIHHPEGRWVPEEADAPHDFASYYPEFSLTDHLGNVRVRFDGRPRVKAVLTGEDIVQEIHYYPHRYTFRSASYVEGRL